MMFHWHHEFGHLSPPKEIKMKNILKVVKLFLDDKDDNFRAETVSHFLGMIIEGEPVIKLVTLVPNRDGAIDALGSVSVELNTINDTITHNGHIIDADEAHKIMKEAGKRNE